MPLAELLLTVAVNVTLWPNTGEVGDELVTVVVVLALPTVCRKVGVRAAGEVAASPL